MPTVNITDKDITIAGHGSKHPSIKNLCTYSASRYACKAKNGVRKGVVAVRRLKGLTDEKRKKFHDAYKSIIGRNYYSQPLRAFCFKKYKNGRYYSDCSSSGIECYKKIGYAFPWLFNTAAIYTEDDYFEDVPVKIKDGHIMNPEILEVGDAILYIGNDSSRPKQIGHVEWVYSVPAKEVPTTKTKKKTYSGEFPVIPDRGYFKLKDTGAEVKKLQKLVNWITGDKITVDGILGKVTLASIKRAQKILKVSDKPAGNFGPKSLEAAKAYKK